MRSRIISAYARFVGRHPWWVLLACAAFAAAAAVTLPFLEFRTARSALSSAENVDETLFDDYLRDFGPNSVVAVIEGGAEAERRAFADALAGKLRDAPGIAGVQHRVPMEFFAAHLLGLIPPEGLEALAGELEKLEPFLGRLAEARGLADVHRALATELESRFKGGARFDPREAGEFLGGLADVVEAERRFLEKPRAAVEELAGLDLLGLVARLGLDPRLSRGGYFTSNDGNIYIVQVTPRPGGDTPADYRPLLATIRAAAASAGEGRPAVRHGLLGIPVTVVEEADTVGADGPRSSIMAAVGIGLLVALAFRRKLVVLLVLAALGVGILWNFGLTWPIFGGLNMITVAVPVILLALGIDFGIHIAIAYEAERAKGRGRGESATEALVRVGPGLLTGSLTTALAFYSICFMEYRGFREFGVVAGNGVLACLAAMVSALPALLIVTDRRQPRPGRSSLPPLIEEAVDEPPDAPSPTSPLGRTWRALCQSLTAFPRMTVAAAAVLTVIFAVLAQGIGFDYRVEDLLPANAESVRTEATLKRYPELTPEFAVILRNDREGLREALERSQGLPAVARRDSILDVIPPGPPETRAALMEKVRKAFAAFEIDPARLAPADREDLAGSLEKLGGVFEKILDMSGGIEGTEAMVRALDRIVNGLEICAGVVRDAPETWPGEYAEASRRLWSWMRERKAEVERMLAAGPAGEKDLPPEILQHYKGEHTGRYALYLYPAEDLSDRKAMERFVEAARSVDPKATGYPVVFLASTDLIHRGFGGAVTAAAAVIFLTLLVDFRRLGLVLLATLPKIIGIIWMLGIMRIFGIDYNLANQIVIPLIIGVGLAYGIHVIHRFIQVPRGERDITAVLEHTGAAIALSGLTTMIGFGSLGIAQHRGLASMGTVLFFGVGSALVASTFVLANIIMIAFRPKR